ncbi:MAG: metallophosphoesterase family protein [Candidatus Aenigmarchaeota archaeon]|nr:metallophosphoesterase family protein [Candidatus Aenigmarchaeota archaeon]
MRILVVADIYGDLAHLSSIIEAAAAHNPSLVVCPGNITDMFAVSEFSQMDVGELVMLKLLSLRKPVLAVPGNHDPPGLIDVFEDYHTNLHGKRRTIQGMEFVGFGGATTPFHTNFEPGEEETQETLAAVSTTIGQHVLVVHNPPKDTKLDTLASGEHVGSAAIRAYILEKKPRLVIAAHIHEAAGKDTLGGSVLFNPGPAFQGKYGIVDLTPAGVVCTSHTIPGSSQATPPPTTSPAPLKKRPAKK